MLERLRKLFGGSRERPRPLTTEEEEARRQADLLERNFSERGPGRWRKVSTFWRRG
jgi:hypothetical protein